MYVYECLFVSIYVICTAQVIAPTSEAVLASTSLVCSSAAVAILSATSVHGICWIFALMLPGSPWVWGSLYLPIFLYESNMIYIYIFHHFPIWIYMIYMFLVFPSLQHLAAFTSAMLRPRPHQSARIEWPWEAPASAVPGWVLPHNSWDIIMISSWYHEPRKGSI